MHTTIEVWEVDLSKYSSAIAFGERVRTQLPRLDAFIANAGVETQELVLAESLEMTLTVTVVSTFMLGRCSAAQTQGNGAQI